MEDWTKNWTPEGLAAWERAMAEVERRSEVMAHAQAHWMKAPDAQQPPDPKAERL